MKLTREPTIQGRLPLAASTGPAATVARLGHPPAMQTHQQHVGCPDDETRALQARLADICKNRSGGVAFFVRQND